MSALSPSEHSPRARGVVLLVLLALIAASLNACVEVSSTPRMPTGNDFVASQSPRGSLVTTNRSQFVVSPLGTIPYDGFRLPLPGPPGLFATVDPELGIVIARWVSADLASPLGVSPITPSAAQSGPPRVIGQFVLTPVIPPGQDALSLGRSSDARGFLIESKGRIGLMPWYAGSDGPIWLTSASDGECSLATILPDDASNLAVASGPIPAIAFSRRRAAGDLWELVVRRPVSQSSQPPAAATPTTTPGASSTLPAHTDLVLNLPGASIVFPIAGSSPEWLVACVFAIDGKPSAELSAITIAILPDRLELVDRFSIGLDGTLAAAGDAVQPLQTPWPPSSFTSSPTREPAPLERGLAIYSPAAFGLLWLDVRVGKVSRLPIAQPRQLDAPVAAIANDWPSPIDGLVLASPSRVWLQRATDFEKRSAQPTGGGVGATSRPIDSHNPIGEWTILAGAYVPRRAWDTKLPNGRPGSSNQQLLVSTLSVGSGVLVLSAVERGGIEGTDARNGGGAAAGGASEVGEQPGADVGTHSRLMVWQIQPVPALMPSNRSPQSSQ